MSMPTRRQEQTMTEGLPRQFLSSLRILFDILDENRSGYVRLQDIESRWSDDGVRGLPPGVVDGLRKVTPPSGLLTFERFVSGLKLVLATRRKEYLAENDMRKSGSAFKENREPLYESQAQNIRSSKGPDHLSKSNTQQVHGNRAGNDGRYYSKEQEQPQHLRAHSGQTQSRVVVNDGNKYNDIERKQNFEGNQRVSQAYSPTYGNYGPPIPRQRSASSSAFALKPDVSAYPNSMGSYQGPSSHGSLSQQQSYPQTASKQPPYQQDRAPPAVPPRENRPVGRPNYSEMKKSKSGPDLHSYSHSPPAVPPRDRHQNNQVLDDLKNWQQEWASGRGRQNTKQQMRDGDAIYANIDQFRPNVDNRQQSPSHQPHPHQQQQQHQSGQQPMGPGKATVRRHGSGRRHTLANGIDQNMLRRMKQLEEEMSILRAGLAMTESAREWYRKQLAAVADKQTMLGKVSYNDNSVEAYQERMNFQRARIAEVNQHLRTLIESSEKGFPLHMNLAVPTATLSIGPASNETGMRSLREQNRRLVDEMNQKKDFIAQLEKEKASLVKELFEARSKNQSNYDDTTFM